MSRADWRAIHGVAFLALAVATAFVPALRSWPLLWLVPLAAYAVLVAAVPPLRATFCPWRFGDLPMRAIIATLIIAIGSCSALVIFHVLTHADVRAYRSYLPVSTPGGVFVLGVLFSVFNAFLEEIIFRGILFDAIESQWGNWMAIVATALLFGYGHMHGYPSGPLGALLAAIYGLCLGSLRVFTNGLGLPIVAHIAADATIFTIVARSGVL